MSFYRSNDVGILFAPDGAYSVDFAAAPAQPPSGGITPMVVVDYVDAAGAIQSTTVEPGVTIITGVAPMLMHIDASGTRLPTAFAAQGAIADAEAYAWHMGGYRLNSGEALTGDWEFGGGSVNEHTGPPIFGHVFTANGTHTVRLKVRDALGSEQTVSFTVVVSAPAAPTIIETSAGAWPAWVSGTHYALRAGANYTSFGAMDFRERHSIIISKTGAGADPIVGTFRPDGRNVINAPEASWQLARNIRTLDIDVAQFAEGGVQIIHCGVVRGRCRTYQEGLTGFYYSNDATNADTRASVRKTRGVFVWKTGVMNRGPSNYVLIGGGRHRHMAGVDFVMNGPVGNSVAALRLYDHESTFRHFRVSNTYQDGGMQTWFSMLGLGDIASYPGYNPVPYTDQVGLSEAVGLIMSTPRKMVLDSFVAGQVGQPWPNGPGSVGGPTNEAWVSELFAVENGVVALSTPTGYGVTPNITMTGRNHSVRNFKYASGEDVAVASSNGPDASYNGPRLIETTNSRPVPTVFA
jgi:PKD repeat protein